MDDSLILSAEEMDQKYQELHNQNYVYPYFYKISLNKQVLFFLGVHHTFDPSNYQFKSIKKHWDEFLKASKKKNSIVLVEGGKRPYIEDVIEAVRKHAEGGFITNLALKVGIESYSPEPDGKYEVDQLAKKFSKEEIMYYYFARTIAQWHRLIEKPDLKVYIDGFLKRNQEITGWDDFDFSFANLVKIHDKFHDHPFDPDNYQCFYDDSNPSHSKASAGSGLIRDEHILSEIKRLWDEGKNIFIVYGSGHAIRLERALTTLGRISYENRD